MIQNVSTRLSTWRGLSQQLEANGSNSMNSSNSYSADRVSCEPGGNQRVGLSFPDNTVAVISCKPPYDLSAEQQG